MANLTQKTKFVNLVVRKKDLDIQDRDKTILRWCTDNCDTYAYIYHDKDTLNGLPIPNHLHLVCTLKQSQRLSTTLNSFCDYVSITTLGVEIDKCNSVEGSIQYLIHKNDSYKYQYDKEKIIHNYGDKDLEVILNTDSDNITPQRLRALVKESHGENYYLIQKLGLNRYIQLRKVIADIKEDLRIWDY